MKYLSLFSGIGGFEKGFEQAAPDWECVGFAEKDKYATSIYKYHYPEHKHHEDVTTIDVSRLPDFNLICGGFPCQSFSIAGKRQGFDDTRGTLFFDVARICEAKRPEWVLLENVKGLLNHDGGKTFATIYGVLTKLGYAVGWEVVNSCHFGVPQNRERIFIVGHLRAKGGRIREILPIGKNDKLSSATDEPNERLSQAQLSTTVRDGIGSKADGTFVIQKIDKSGCLKKNQNVAACLTGGGNSGGNHSDMDLLKYKSGTWRTHKDGQGFRELDNSDISPCIPARAREDGSGQPVINENGIHIRRLTPTECERLQGFPDGWTEKGENEGVTDISDTQRYKCLGNAVTVNVIESIARKINAIHRQSDA